jgi:LPXTG-motif cell wall-anchored protein
MVTVGCTYINSLCDPDMRIWSISNEASSFPYLLLGAVGIVVVIAVTLAFFLVKKKRK